MQGSQVKVSVIVTFYNASRYIERCARSLFNQSMETGIEFIFVDDGSCDDGIDILNQVIKTFPSRSHSTTLLVNDFNCGVSASRQRGLNEACGEYVIYCDADDYVEPDMYEQMYLTASNSGADIAVCDYLEECGDNQIVHCDITDCDKETVVNGLLSGRIHGGLWNKLIRRQLYGSIGRPFIQGADMLEDVSVMSRLAARAAVVAKVTGAYYHYTQDSPNAVTRQWTKEAIDGMILNIDRVIAFFSNGYPEIDLNDLKYRIRLQALYHSHESMREHYRSLYPDVPHGFRLDVPVLTIYQRVIACCRDCHMDMLADLLVKFRSVINCFRA